MNGVSPRLDDEEIHDPFQMEGFEKACPATEKQE